MKQWEILLLAGKAEDKGYPAIAIGTSPQSDCQGVGAGWTAAGANGLTTYPNPDFLDLCPSCTEDTSKCSACLGDYEDDLCWGDNNWNEIPSFTERLRNEYGFDEALVQTVSGVEGIEYLCFGMNNGTCQKVSMNYTLDGDNQVCNVGAYSNVERWQGGGVTRCTLHLY